MFYDPAAQGRRHERILRETLQGLARLGLRMLGVVGTPSKEVETALTSMKDRPLFVGRGRYPLDCRLPDGPMALIYGQDAVVTPSDLDPRQCDRERLLLVPQGMPGAHRKDLLLRDTWSGATISLQELHNSI